MVDAYERGHPPPESFDALGVDIARFQAEHVAGYGRLCAAHGVDPSAISAAHRAPAVPADAFKMGHVFAFDESTAAVTFRTSGTTLGARGTHHIRDVRTYDAASLAFGRAMLAPEAPGPLAVIVLGPSPANAPDSSLAHMCALFARHFDPDEPVQRTFFVREGRLDVVALRERVRERAPALVLATSFALVHLVDALGAEVLALPPGSRVMLTGGYKGKSREVEPDVLRGAVARTFALEDRALVGEYGMTELSSQFWQSERHEGQAARVYLEPPWARVSAVDPRTLAPLANGEIGIARIEDLANVDSAFAVVTQDRVRRVGAGFELLGRAQGAVPRGCSIGLDEMLLARAPGGDDPP